MAGMWAMVMVTVCGGVGRARRRLRVSWRRRGGWWSCLLDEAGWSGRYVTALLVFGLETEEELQGMVAQVPRGYSFKLADVRLSLAA